jgi:hypothetical protein
MAGSGSRQGALSTQADQVDPVVLGPETGRPGDLSRHRLHRLLEPEYESVGIRFDESKSRFQEFMAQDIGS